MAASPPNSGDNFPFPSVFDSGFARALDPTILLANTLGGVPVPRANFHLALLILMGDANLNVDDFHVTSEVLDSRFEIKFGGDLATAAAKCKQFFQSLQLGKGRWKPQSAKNENGVFVQFFVGTDKNPLGVRRDILTKALRDIIAAKISPIVVFCSKQQGTIFVDRKKVCTLHILSSDDVRFDWYHDQRTRLKLDQAEVEAEFHTHQAARLAQRP